MTQAEKILARLDTLARRLGRIEARLDTLARTQKPPEKLGYSVREAAELTGIGQHEIRAMIRAGNSAPSDPVPPAAAPIEYQPPNSRPPWTPWPTPTRIASKNPTPGFGTSRDPHTAFPRRTRPPPPHRPTSRRPREPPAFS